MSLCTVVIIACHPPGIFLSQNVLKNMLKSFTYSLYHIRTMPHESISIIGRIANPPGMELCGVQVHPDPTVEVGLLHHDVSGL